jgi:rhamnulose-1-phosphate aldolase
MTSSYSAYEWDDLANELGAAGVSLTQLNAAEGSAGNLSVYVHGLEGLGDILQHGIQYLLPVEAPALAGGWTIVTGTGRRLRDIAGDPLANLCVLQIHQDGKSSTLYANAGLRPTSEFNSHLAVHNDRVSEDRLAYHAIVHAQPRYLTYLSHHSSYQDIFSLNRRLMRWEPETIMAFPDGIGLIPFQLPGSPKLTSATTELMRIHHAVVWSRHGILTRSDTSILGAGDLVEYLEAAAQLEYLNLQLGEPSQGLSLEDLIRICTYRGISAPALKLMA